MLDDIKRKWEIKEELMKLSKKKATNEELLDFLTSKGYNPHEVIDCIKELIHQQLGTDVGAPNDERIKSIMLQMMGYGLSPEKMWEYLDDFKVPPAKRVELIKEVYEGLKSGKIKKPTMSGMPPKYSDEDIMNDRIADEDRLICTMCGNDCSRLTKKDRKCPSCDYHMIKIMRDSIIKQGMPKDKVIDALLNSNTFTDEEKDMIR